MPPDLAAFQREFATAILTEESPTAPFRSPAFAVYRNTAARGVVEALRASYPTVDELLGDEMFTQVALDYRREQPPSSPVLSDFGAGLAAFLARQPWTSELPYLADVATLDWLWLQTFLAAGIESVPARAGPQSLIMLHPAARFVRLATPALTIWMAHRGPDGFDELEPEWREEYAMFTRPALEVRAHAVDAACHALLQACAIPTRVENCVATVALSHPQANVPVLLQQCIAAGALIIR